MFAAFIRFARQGATALSGTWSSTPALLLEDGAYLLLEDDSAHLLL
jgi:hypothetical protein